MPKRFKAVIMKTTSTLNKYCSLKVKAKPRSNEKKMYNKVFIKRLLFGQHFTI